MLADISLMSIGENENKKRENELLKRKLDIAIEALKETWPGYTYAIAVNAFYRSKLKEIEEMK